MRLLTFAAIISLCCNHSLIGKEVQGHLKPLIQKKSRVLRISPIWLNELEQSYQIAFEHQFGLLKYTDNSTVANHNTRRESKNTCQNVSYLSFDQNKRLIDQFGYNFVLNSTISEMLDNPRARLFQFQDHWGDYFSIYEHISVGPPNECEWEDYHFSRSKRYGTCTHLIHLFRRVKSIFTFGKCTRLFEHEDCRGWSIAIYPGSSNSHGLELPRHVTLKSIGPCLENEFSGGFLNESLPGFVVKNPEIRSFQPDLVMLFNPAKKMGSTKLFAGLWVKYLLGPRNRTEIIETILASANESQRTSTLFTMNFEASLEKEDGDILGHALPTVIGGPANEAFNIFPANESALKKWEDVLRHISGNYTEFVIFHLQFEYENENKTRPLFFYYRIFVIQVDNRIFLVHFGRIINGDQANLRREKPNIQSIPKFEYKGTQHINLTQVLDNRRVSKIIHSFPSYTSIQNINRKVDIRVNIWHRCKNMGLMNDIELKEMYSNSSLLNAQIEGMIKNPMVRLFSGENLTGESQDFHLGKTRNLVETYKGCSNVDELANVKPAETFGTCIRLFEDVKCEKMSLAIYGGSSNSLGRINRILKQVKSVGPCVEDEFVHATFIDRNSGTVTKDPNSSSYFPDKVQFGGFEWEKVLSFRRRSDGLRNIYYVLGPKNRIEYILTWFDQIGPAEISNPVNVEETEFYKSLDKEEGDVPCYAIPLEFYGPANKSFNVFPISQSKVDDWRRIFPFISDSNENLYFYTELRFVYGSDLSSRPQFVYYHFSIEIVDRIYYGRFNNL